jgi:hypothetical protein
MWKLNPISHLNFIKKMKKLWFDWPLFMSKWTLDLTIPNKHSNNDIWIWLLSRILNQANIDIDTWNNIK